MANNLTIKFSSDLNNISLDEIKDFEKIFTKNKKMRFRFYLFQKERSIYRIQPNMIFFQMILFLS